MADLLRFHSCKPDGRTFVIGDPTWINPAYVVRVSVATHGGRRHALIRLAGDDNYQDWTLLWDTIDEAMKRLDSVNPVQAKADP